MNDLDLLRAKLAAWVPTADREWECVNCAEFNKGSECWYCGSLREV